MLAARLCLSLVLLLVGCTANAPVEIGVLGTPWSEAESRLAEQAAVTGVDEMIAFLAEDPRRTAELGGDAVESLIDASYAPREEFAETARRAERAARRSLEIALDAWPRKDGRLAGEAGELLPFAIYAQQLFGPEDPRTAALISATNGAMESVSDLSSLVGFDVDRVLEADPPPVDELYSLVLWSITLTEAQTIPGLKLPDGAEELLSRLWPVLESYAWPRAEDLEDGANDYGFYDTAYLATHVGYIPTGYGRYPLRIDDAPWLLAFLRENFDAVMEMGELDLLAEFVDLLRQFGFDESDPQVRRGTRTLLRLYQRAGNSWIAHREDYEVGEEVSDYDLLHKPWTAVSGVLSREPTDGDYARIFRAAIR